VDLSSSTTIDELLLCARADAGDRYLDDVSRTLLPWGFAETESPSGSRRQRDSCAVGANTWADADGSLACAASFP
jgi:hypothetical protein